jgi:UDP-N-acetylglucosamine acyltransferase
MATVIHPTAIVDPAARLADGVEIGAYSVIGASVEIGEGTRVHPHVVISGHTRIGRDTEIHPFCSIGGAPQDKKYAGEPTLLEIGDRNTLREYVTMNCGTAQDVGVTRVGNDNWIMAYVHVAHDCQVGNHTIMANNTALAGHVHVGDWAILGGFTGVHQFVRVGAHSFCGVHSSVLQDVPPFVLANGVPAAPHGINSEGLRPPRLQCRGDRCHQARLQDALPRRASASKTRRRRSPKRPVRRLKSALLSDFLAAGGRGIIR